MTVLGPGVTLRGYRVEGRLGGGGHAVTWRAVEVAGGREVVIKQFRLAEAPDWKVRELFLRECATLKSLSHPAIPAYVDAFEEALAADTAPELFLVQAFVDAPNLATLIREERRWSTTELVGLARQALEVLAWLHGRHPPVIHRDLKPSNLLLRPRARGELGALSLIDFTAVTAASHDGADGGSTIVGTHGYMPPEQLLGQAGPASDLYALGMTLVHLASGQHPATLPLDGLRRDLRGVLNLPPPLEGWLARLVDPDPRGRPESAEAALRELEAAVAPRRPAPRKPAEGAVGWPRRLAIGGVFGLIAASVWIAKRPEDASGPELVRPAVEAPSVPQPPRRPPAESSMRELEVDVDAPEGLRVHVRAARLRPGGDTFRESEAALVYTLENTGGARLGAVRLRVVLAGTGIGARQVHDLEPISLLRVPLEPAEVRVEAARLYDVPRNTTRARLSFEETQAGLEVPPVNLTPASFTAPVFMPDGTAMQLSQRRTWLITDGLSGSSRAFDFELRLSGVARIFALTLAQTCLDAAGGRLPKHNDRDFVVMTRELGAPTLNDDEAATFRVLCPAEAASVSWALGELTLAN
jgi:hypothetical protein